MEKKRILVIDDDREVCDVIRDMLIAGGYEAFTAFDGREGLAMAEEEQPNLILLDIMMPGMDGFEVLRRLKANTATSEIPIVIVSAKRDAASLFKARELKSSDYVMKPFSSQELIKIVERCFSLFGPRPIQIDPKLATEISEKLQEARTALDMLSQGKDVPKDFIDKAYKRLSEAEKALKDSMR